jgi:hypothetical protein
MGALSFVCLFETLGNLPDPHIGKTCLFAVDVFCVGTLGRTAVSGLRPQEKRK